MKYVLAVISICLLLIIVAGAAFFFGQKSISNNAPFSVPTVGVTNNTNPATKIEDNSSEPTAVPNTTVEAGGVLVFSSYSLEIPQGWSSAKQTGQNMDILTLSKGQYKIILSQVAGDGGGCTYANDPKQQFAQHFASYTEVANNSGYIFRRGANGTPGGFTVCQKNSSDGSFGFPTTFGNISINTPTPSDTSSMAQIDAILASLKKK